MFVALHFATHPRGFKNTSNLQIQIDQIWRCMVFIGQQVYGVESTTVISEMS